MRTTADEKLAALNVAAQEVFGDDGRTVCMPSELGQHDMFWVRVRDKGLPISAELLEHIPTEELCGLLRSAGKDAGIL